MKNEKKKAYSEYPVDITKLKENFEKGITKYKYKELCELVGQPCTPDGSSRVSQKKYLGYFFKYHREGHSYIIEEIYDIPKDDLYTMSKRSQYYKDCIYTILKYVDHKLTHDNTDILYKSELAEILGFINKDFNRLYFKNINELTKLGIKKQFIDAFYARITTSYKNILKNTLTKMQKQGLIEYNEVLCGISKSEGLHILNCEEIENVEKITKETYKIINEEHPVYKYYLPEVEEGWGEPNPMRKEARKCEITSLKDIFRYHLEDIFFYEKQRKIQDELGLRNINLVYCITAQTPMSNFNSEHFKADSLLKSFSKVNHTYAEQKKNDYEKIWDRKIKSARPQKHKEEYKKAKDNFVPQYNILIDKLIKINKTINELKQEIN